MLAQGRIMPNQCCLFAPRVVHCGVQSRGHRATPADSSKTFQCAEQLTNLLLFGPLESLLPRRRSSKLSSLSTVHKQPVLTSRWRSSSRQHRITSRSSALFTMTFNATFMRSPVLAPPRSSLSTWLQASTSASMSCFQSRVQHHGLFVEPCEPLTNSWPVLSLTRGSSWQSGAFSGVR